MPTRTGLIQPCGARHRLHRGADKAIDPRTQTLTVYRHAPEGYLNVLVAERGEVVRAEPFDAIALRLGLLFGDDPDDPVPAP